MHEAPHVPHFGLPSEGPTMRPGMFFTIEPMVNLGGPETVLLDDGWTVLTADGRLSAQFEHTILVTDDGAEIMTPRPES
jgi:methionyl aminopeptidase